MKRVRAGIARGNAGRLRRTAEEGGVGFAPLLGTPIAVVDVETTGLKAGDDRVVEVCVIRLEPTGEGWRREVALSTLVNPGRPMGASHIHGITDQDVAQAPSFGGVSRAVVGALHGAVLAGWNVHFDVRFLQAELAQAGLACALPHICAMRLRAMAGLGPAVSLKRACEAHGVHLWGHHSAEGDTQATATLVELSLLALGQRGIERFRDLRRVHGYSFTKSFGCMPLAGDEVLLLPEGEALVRREAVRESQPARH